MFTTILGGDIDTESGLSDLCRHVRYRNSTVKTGTTWKRAFNPAKEIDAGAKADLSLAGAIYLRGAMMSFVSGYYGTEPRRQHRRTTGIRRCILLGTAFRKFTSVERLTERS